MTDLTALDDPALLLLIQQGDESAFKEVYYRYWEQLLATGYYYTQNRQTAEEIVHDVLISLWNKRDALLIQSLPAYLGTAVKYAVFKAMARNRRRQELLEGQALPTDTDRGTEDRLDARFLKDVLEGVLEQLPEKARLVFKYSREDQLSVREIAEKMELSPKSVEYYMTKTIKTLREYVRKFNVLFF